MKAGPQYFGKYRATVLNNVDLESRGRIQVQLADRFGPFPSTWALPAFQMAALQSGLVTIPPIRASVWIEFEAGDPDYPIWSGGFYEAPGQMPPLAMAGTPATPNIVMQTVGQVTLMLSDNPAANVLIKTLTGAMITIGEAGIIISNGKGASISMVGPSVIVNGGALTVT
ncbi:phage baseplate assembly protein V [Ancylobacter sp. 6x-1]|uniref:Phage baseplate assembly protein V n=1 Tax=Ancylobacter crimeensis TaxID=2579147 RepID=A0ABT0D5Y0_9HYPH|nr:phage baseplate assembly protein V [Ancylobacter crimeensis]MCK0195353.1 phage baseplate assembly protein V [Ancylobacter crimeensis]